MAMVSGMSKLLERFGFETKRLFRCIGTCVVGHVDQRRGGEFDRGEAGAKSARRQHLVEQRLRHRLAGLHMQRMLFQHRRHRQPMLVELRRQFDEIAADRSAGDRRPGDVGQHAMQRMAEFVEQGLCLVDRQQGRLARRRFGEIHDVVDDRLRAIAEIDSRTSARSSRRRSASRAARNNRRGTGRVRCRRHFSRRRRARPDARRQCPAFPRR